MTAVPYTHTHSRTSVTNTTHTIPTIQPMTAVPFTHARTHARTHQRDLLQGLEVQRGVPAEQQLQLLRLEEPERVAAAHLGAKSKQKGWGRG
jgi:hypothetical protein